MIPPGAMIRSVQTTFFRHDRWYCIFSVAGRDEEFLYYAHTSLTMRSLMSGEDFLASCPGS